MEKKSFFSKFDWAAFWMATLATFAVYFYTLGPSVGLEDSGELATASAHLGVPHPPGYPFWTFCTWIFCKIFSGVTYMGHPTPAWAVSLCSAVFGAFAAGCTAMLICRSAKDMIDQSAGEEWRGREDGALSGDILACAGGIGGALAFSLSPVEWSQSTIVEIYSLNALFLMWVFLLSYRWMKRPSDRILWITAFVFGLGLTNYQVLLFAIVPLAIIIAIKNFAMFRDFSLYLIPAALVYQILKIGDMQRANSEMQADVIAKHFGLVSAACPSSFPVAAAVVLVVAALASAIWLKARPHRKVFDFVPLAVGGAGLAVLAVSFYSALDRSWAVASDGFWTADALQEAVPGVPSIVAPLIEPWIYAAVAGLVLASAAIAAFAVLRRDDEDRTAYFAALAVSAVCAVFAVALVDMKVPQAGWAGYEGVKYLWGDSSFICYALVALLVACSLFVKGGLAYSIPVAGFHLAVFLLLKRGAMNGLVHPASWWFWWPVAWNFVVLALAWLVLPYGKSLAGAAFFTQLGVSFYAYMPIVSDLRNPPMNWGFPRTWDGFKHALTRGQYEAISLPEFKGAGEVWDFIKSQMAHYFADVKMTFSDFLVFFALVPFSCWRLSVPAGNGKKAVLRLPYLVLAGLAVLLVRSLMGAFSVGTGPAWQMFDRVVLAAMSLVCVLGAAVSFLRQVVFRTAVAGRRYVAGIVRRRDWCQVTALSAVAPAVFATCVFCLNGSSMAKVLAWCVLAAVAILVSLGLFAPKIAVLSGKARKKGFAVSFDPGGVSQQWLFASGVCFLVMTVPLIALAQVKGDLQDGFIQKVKFISSHAMIALWIGYGLFLAGFIAVRLAVKHGFPGKTRLFAYIAAAAIVLGAGIAPVVQNYTDDDLVRKLGGSEQNNHTFGWQFGAYQLEGANAIRAQITADEEPLPDPSWPEPMEKYSIFFGGTDPGRFVPTYMIYSAAFRPDVYLITQNALADDTYMAVERDLYGDEIWIPAKEDSRDAFQRYVEEVKSGVRQANGDLKMENGKVQVTGALGVMEINSILTEMMWNHDKSRHSFYVEESYAIQWMYPYLSPHGLIMKLNASRTPYDAKTAAKDRDFWDWYSRRLLDDPMFRRDFAAQKSFSKLRAAIAGLYRTQGRYADASVAYREAHLLYPASPEATFRYASEILVPMDRLAHVDELMEYTDFLDPNNKRTGRMRRYVEVRREMDSLEEKLKTENSLSVRDTMALASCYGEIGRVRDAGTLAAQALPRLSTAKELETAIDILIPAARNDDAEKALKRYLGMTKKPAVGRVVEMAIIQHRNKKFAYAYSLMDKASSAAPESTADMLSRYAATLPAEDMDAFLLLKISKMYMKANNRQRTYEMFISAWSVSPEMCQAELQRDRSFLRYIEPLISRSKGGR